MGRLSQIQSQPIRCPGRRDVSYYASKASSSSVPFYLSAILMCSITTSSLTLKFWSRLKSFIYMTMCVCGCRYLEEVGYSDTILDMRSKRVRSLLGRSSPEANGPPPSESCPEPEPRAGGESLLVRQIEEQIKRWDSGNTRPSLILHHRRAPMWTLMTE